jgi:hypothetical protein
MACSSIKCEEFIFSKLHIQDIVLVAMVTAVMFVQPIPIFDKTGLNPYASLIIVNGPETISENNRKAHILCAFAMKT